MQLDEFITETLKGIIKGINDSQKFASENNAEINPLRDIAPLTLSNEVKINGKTKFKQFSIINFDIAVTAATEKGTGFSGGIEVLSIGIGGKKSESIKDQTVSRIQFDVVAMLPTSPFE